MSDSVITEVIFIPTVPTNKGHIGFASCKLDNKIVLNSISVYTRLDGGIRCLYPLNKISNGKELNTYFPITKELGLAIEQAIFNKIQEVQNQNAKERR